MQNTFFEDDYQMIEPCPEGQYRECETCPCKPIITSQKELDDANELLQEWESDEQFIKTFKADPDKNNVGGTMKPKVPIVTEFSDVPGTWKQWLALPFSSVTPSPSIYEYERPASLSEQNEFLSSDYHQIYNHLDDKIAYAVFNATDQWPVINGKTIGADQLETAMKDPEMKKTIMDQAATLEKLPEVFSNTDLFMELQNYHLTQSQVGGIINEFNKVISKNYITAADIATADLKSKDPYEIAPPVSMILTDDGRIKDINEFTVDWLNFASSTVFQTAKGILGDKFNSQILSPLLIPAGSVTDKNRKNIVNNFKQALGDGLQKTLISSPDVTSNETVYKLRGMRLAANNQFDQIDPEKISEFYYGYLTKLKKAYDDPKSKGINKLAPLLIDPNNPFNTVVGNRGGDIQSIPQYITVNASEYDDEETFIMTPEAEELSKLSTLVREDDDPKFAIKYGAGGVKSKIPDWKEGKAFMNRVFERLAKMKTPPNITIRFQDIVAGNDDYHAFTIKFDQTEFLDKFKKKYLSETDTDEEGLFTGNKLSTYDDVIANGITMYVPKKLSQSKTNFGGHQKQNIEVSAVKGLLNMTGHVNLLIPETGNLNMRVDKDSNNVIVGGYNIGFNPNTKQLDTFRFSDQVIPGANAFGIDKYINARILDFMDTHRENANSKRKVLEQQKKSNQ